MRIIAGDLKSRKLASPPERTETRPIPDRVKESLFNLLRGHVEGQTVLDAFAGTGSVGLEAISRGAARCVFVEKDKRMAAVLRQNIESLGVGDRCEVVEGDALGASTISRCPRPVHLIFYDPPYRLVTDPDSRGRVFHQFSRLASLLDDDGFALLRTPRPLVDLIERPEHETPLKREVSLEIEGTIGPETHNYGPMAVHLYQRDPRVTGPRDADA